MNLRRIDRGGDEGVGQPIQLALSKCVPPEALEEPVRSIDLLVFYASRESIVVLADAIGQDAKGMLDQLGEG